MTGTVTPSRLAFETDQWVTSQLNSTKAPSEPAIVRYRMGSHAALVAGIACDSPSARLSARQNAAPIAVPTALRGMTACFGACLSRTLASAAELAATKTVSSPAIGTET